MNENLKTKIISECPECGHKLDAAICPKKTDAKQKQGDLSMCFHCYTVLYFNNKLKLKKIDMDMLSSENREFLLRMRDEAIKAKEWYRKLN